MAILTELDFQLLHFIVMEILLDEVALSLYSSLHFRGNIRNHPGHKELDQKHNMLWNKKEQQVSFTSSWSQEELQKKLCMDLYYLKKCVCSRMGVIITVTIDYCPW